LCSGVWHEFFGMMITVAVGFLYMLNIILLWSLEMVISRKIDCVLEFFFHGEMHFTCAVTCDSIYTYILMT
jgi:hypothetical protein